MSAEGTNKFWDGGGYYHTIVISHVILYYTIQGDTIIISHMILYYVIQGDAIIEQ